TIGHHIEFCRTALETQSEGSIAVFPDCLQGCTRLNSTWTQPLRNCPRQTFVAAGEVISLIGSAEYAEVSRYRLIRKQVSQIHRTVDNRIGAVFDRVRYVEQLAHRRTVAACHMRFDPVVHADIVEFKSCTVEVVIERWIAGCIEVVLESLRQP